MVADPALCNLTTMQNILVFNLPFYITVTFEQNIQVSNFLATGDMLSKNQILISNRLKNILEEEVLVTQLIN